MTLKPQFAALVSALLSATLAPLASAQCGPQLDQVLAPPDPQASAEYGRSIALRGDLLVTGAPKADFGVNGPGFRGAAYVWRWSAGAWSLEQKLDGPPAPLSGLGSAVDVDADVLAVSGFANSTPTERMYVFRRTAGAWQLEANLVPSDPQTSGSQPLNDVAIEGDWAVAGHFVAYGAPVVPGFARTGAVYVYHHSGGQWLQHSKLVPADAAAGDMTGQTVELRGGVLAFSSRSGSSSATLAGRVHIYRVSAGGPVFEALLTQGTPSGDYFGQGLSTDGARLAIGDLSDASTPGSQGAAHVYRFDSGAWVHEQTLRPTLPAGVSAQFGKLVAIDGEHLLVAGSTPDRLWHFRRINGVWIDSGLAQTPSITSYGVSSLSVSSGRVAVGARSAQLGATASGGAFVFDSSASQSICTQCVAKVNSAGCTPAIGWSGAPVVGGTTAFSISATQVLTNKSGLLFYGGPSASPVAFQGGQLCVAQPLRRTPLQVSTGTGACGGSFDFDFAAHLASGVDPQLVAGAVVRAQFWSRDPAASFTSNITDALQFTLLP